MRAEGALRLYCRACLLLAGLAGSAAVLAVVA